MRQRTVLIAGAFAIGILAALASPALAQPGRFSIQPAGTADARGASYFSYALQPGAAVSDLAVVVNEGADPITLTVYPADGVTATNGGTAFSANGQHRDGTHAWIAVDVAKLNIPAGSRVAVPFTLRVPAAATPGDHFAGLVVEAPPAAGSAGGIAAAVVQRAGVAVVVRVPGAAAEKLVFGAVCVNRETGSSYVQLVASNQGQLLTRGTGTLALRSASGATVFERPVQLGTVLPGDATFLRLDTPVAIGPGRYTAAIEVRQIDGQVASLVTPIEVGASANGCVVADAAPPPVAPRPASVQATTNVPPAGPPIALLVGLGALAGAVTAGAVVRLLRK